MSDAVETASSEFCDVHSYVNVTLPTGFIVAAGGSQPTSDDDDDGPTSTCDHSVKPWVIAARRGQRINLTLYDFALAAGRSAAGGGGRICRQYGWLDDSAFDRPSPLCATDRRVSRVYTSRGHVVKLWTMTPPTSASADRDVASAATDGGAGKRFMIKYSGAPGICSKPRLHYFDLCRCFVGQRVVHQAVRQYCAAALLLICCGLSICCAWTCCTACRIRHVVEQIHSTNRCKWSLGVTPRRSMSLIDLSPIDASSLDVFTAAAAAAAWGDRNVA